ncbi:MAG: 30S ribosomal protein S5 [Candidatus Pacebacteria bacterium]|nr:30S ribosomal protein S5 [Candidatus Paceibacterota bacterium]
MFDQKNKNKPFKKFKREEREFESKLLDLSRIAHMKAGGRRFRFRALIIAGNKKGKIGVGVAKGKDVAQAIAKSTRLAEKKLITVPIINNTIPHEVEAKFSTVRILLKPQKKGRGLVAGGTVRDICELAGIKDISSKLLSRTKNKLNIAKATIKALEKLKKIKQQTTNNQQQNNNKK